MQAAVPIKLSELQLQPYINDQGIWMQLLRVEYADKRRWIIFAGQIPFDPSSGNVGVYAIYDHQNTLRFVGQSRYCDNSLR